MKRVWLFLPLGLLAVIVVLMMITYQQLDYERDNPMVGQHVPQLVLEAVDEGEIDLADLQGQPYLLHVGASWCEGCVQETPHLVELANEGVSVVGVFYRDSAEGVLEYISKHANAYELALLDPKGQALVNLGGMALPSTYVVDEGGVIQAVIAGPIQSVEQVRRLLPSAPSR